MIKTLATFEDKLLVQWPLTDNRNDKNELLGCSTGLVHAFLEYGKPFGEIGHYVQMYHGVVAWTYYDDLFSGHIDNISNGHTQIQK
jgi:hypothetical protein